MLTVVVDSPEQTRRWWEIVDELTAETGLVTSEIGTISLVTSEIVPAVRAVAPDVLHGGLRLAATWPDLEP